MLNPFRCIGRSRGKNGLPQSGDDRTRGEDRKTVASEALHGATEPTVGYARQPEVLLGEIQMGRRRMFDDLPVRVRGWDCIPISEHRG